MMVLFRLTFQLSHPMTFGAERIANIHPKVDIKRVVNLSLSLDFNQDHNLLKARLQIVQTTRPPTVGFQVYSLGPSLRHFLRVLLQSAKIYRSRPKHDAHSSFPCRHYPSPITKHDRLSLLHHHRSTSSSSSCSRSRRPCGLRFNRLRPLDRKERHNNRLRRASHRARKSQRCRVTSQSLPSTLQRERARHASSLQTALRIQRHEHKSQSAGRYRSASR